VPPEAALWRYQLTAPIQGTFSDRVILTDTVTGHCWLHSDRTTDRWEDLRSPLDRKP
jgi:hypothetical protein